MLSTLTHPDLQILMTMETGKYLLMFVLSTSNKKDTSVRNTAWIGFNLPNLWSLPHRELVALYTAHWESVEENGHLEGKIYLILK